MTWSSPTGNILLKTPSHMIYTMLKSSFVNIEPKQLNYRDFKNFSFEVFDEDLSEVLAECTSPYETFGKCL